HFHVVLDDQDGEVGSDASDQRDDGMRLGHAHARRRLVQAEEPGLRRERDADLEVPLLAVGEVGREVVLLLGEAHGGEDVARPIDDIGVRPVMAEQAPRMVTRLGGDPDVLAHRGAGQDVGDLVRAGDGLPRDTVRGKPRDVLAGEQGAARGRRLRRTKPGHAFWNEQAGGTNVFSFGTTSRSLCLLFLMSKINSRMNAWWSSLRRVLAPYGKSSPSFTSMPSSASMSFRVSSRPRKPDRCIPSLRKFIASKFDCT